MGQAVLNALLPGTITGPITVPAIADRIQVVATVRWADGTTQDVAGVAVAWTKTAAKVRWYPHGKLPATQHSEWLPAGDVRRPH